MGSIEEFVKKQGPFNSIFIDIPIGLLSRGKSIRACDREARKILGRPRSSSIFPVPCRDAVYVETYKLANKINRDRIRKGLSKQSWNISSKIKEMDQFMQGHDDAKDYIFESHPEVCFWALNDRKPMKHYKKTQEGINERKELLKEFWEFPVSPLVQVSRNYQKKDLEIDDVLDAWVLALSAERHPEIKFLPNPYEYDDLGIPMRICYSDFNR